jgi:hypothetical protein
VDGHACGDHGDGQAEVEDDEEARGGLASALDGRALGDRCEAGADDDTLPEAADGGAREQGLQCVL